MFWLKIVIINNDTATKRFQIFLRLIRRIFYAQNDISRVIENKFLILSKLQSSVQKNNKNAQLQEIGKKIMGKTTLYADRLPQTAAESRFNSTVS